jgi:tryptophanyl-tRNA synthetase
MQVFSGIQPTGVPHLGNYFGAIRSWLRYTRQFQSRHPNQDCRKPIFCVVDLHAMTRFRTQEPHKPEAKLLRRLPPQPTVHRASLDMTAWLLASGLDPEQCILYRQSHLQQHGTLSWLVGCFARHGELTRMTQWKVGIGTWI